MGDAGPFCPVVVCGFEMVCTRVEREDTNGVLVVGSEASIVARVDGDGRRRLFSFDETVDRLVCRVGVVVGAFPGDFEEVGFEAGEEFIFDGSCCFFRH